MSLTQHREPDPTVRPPGAKNTTAPTHASDPRRFAIACSASALVLVREGKDGAAKQLRELAGERAASTGADT